MYGVAKTSGTGKITLLKKNRKYVSDLAITGLYFFDKNVVKYAKQQAILKKWVRNYWFTKNLFKEKKLISDILGRGAWLDTGSIEDFDKRIVSAIENRQGFKIACLEKSPLTINGLKRDFRGNAIL